MNKKKTANVSIVSANFNNGKYLKEFLDSVINSTMEPKELIIVDDGSKDNSVQILRQYNLDFLIIVELVENKGFAKALNIGVKKASAEYILRVDPDDLLERTRIEKQYSLLKKYKDIDLTGSNVIYFNETIQNKVGSSNFPERTELINKRYYKGEHGLLHGTIMGKTDLFKKHPYFQENVPAEDYDVFSRMIKNGANAKSISEALTFVRIHQNSVSNSLPFSTVKKTYDLRDKIFGTNTSFLKVGVNYLNLKYYRKYYFEKHLFKKLWFLCVSCVFRPDKVIKKLC